MGPPLVEPVLLTLLTMLGVLCTATAAVALWRPQLLSKTPWELRRRRRLLAFVLAASLTGLAVLWGAPRPVAVVLAAQLVAGAFVLPRLPLPWKLDASLLKFAFFVGGSLWFAGHELIGLPDVPPALAIPATMAIGLVLGHRYQEVLAAVRAPPLGQR